MVVVPREGTIHETLPSKGSIVRLASLCLHNHAPSPNSFIRLKMFINAWGMGQGGLCLAQLRMLEVTVKPQVMTLRVKKAVKMLRPPTCTGM